MIFDKGNNDFDKGMTLQHDVKRKESTLHNTAPLTFTDLFSLSGNNQNTRGKMENKILCSYKKGLIALMNFPLVTESGINNGVFWTCRKPKKLKVLLSSIII